MLDADADGGVNEFAWRSVVGSGGADTTGVRVPSSDRCFFSVGMPEVKPECEPDAMGNSELGPLLDDAEGSSKDGNV